MENQEYKPGEVKQAKDIKVRLSDMGYDSLFLVNGEYIPCSNLQIVEHPGDTGKLLIEIPLVFVEILPKELYKNL